MGRSAVGMRAALFAVLAVLCAAPALAQPVSDQTEAVPPPIDANALAVASGIDPRLRGTIEGLFSGLVGSDEVPGAVVLVIRNGEVVYKAGFGFADIETRKPTDPTKTRFRVGSISKLFTATAV